MARPIHPKAGPGRPKGRLNERTLHRQMTARDLIRQHFPGGREGLFKRACELANAGDAQILKVLLAYDSGPPPQEVNISGTQEQPLVLKIIREDRNGNSG